MNKIESFLAYCAGASLPLLKRCPTETPKYVGIGASILFTGLLASLSAGYALYSVFDNVYLALVLGLFWGLIIFNLDRYIVLSMRKHSPGKELLQAIPRMVLAILIAVVISRPLELRIFDKEIQTELQLIGEELTQERELEVKKRFAYRQDSLQTEVEFLQAAIYKKEELRNKLIEQARQEADGSGGSGKINPGPIYKIKEANAMRVQQELDVLKKTNNRLIEEIREQMNLLKQEQRTAINAFDKPDTNGLSFQLLALNRLGKKYPSIALADWFLLLLIIALELTPIATKLIAPRGPYDDLLQVREHYFSNYRKEKIALNNLDLERKIDRVVAT